MSKIHPHLKDNMNDEEILQQLLACFYGINSEKLQYELIMDTDEAMAPRYGKGYVVAAWNAYRLDINRLSKL